MDANHKQKPLIIFQRPQGAWPKVGQEMTPEAQLFMDQVTEMFKETGPYYTTDIPVPPTK
ncbi:hypothetical protein GBK02_10275 [Dechloromonas sp. TW-R-39-2]|uniref:hypothetical protein n=1 Tax=Dechloromonas sp. TW-R-39-2 TaxID=2654218 RepID=UPI00193C87B4|nr:hypothetical protein [Dechloromonas sp. TW-R-39-2]QRM19760.1 hypothetical protein GBK02_10275 [Dechloromonas sp. TW-R-39-2]